MEIGSLFIFLALLLLVGLFVSRPLFEHRSIALSQSEHQYSALLADRDRILESIRELDMDFAMGKIDPADYSDQRTALLQRGADTLRRLDELEPDSRSLESDRLLREASAPLPEEMAQVSSLPASARDFDYDLENLVSARRQSKSGKAAGFCHQCGRPIHQQDRFCSHCGATV